MTERSVKAKICWVKEEAGGRQSPPAGPRYVTVVRFDDEQDKWPSEAWSLVVDFHESPDESLCMTADVSFLAPEAPVELLRTGSTFQLFEGAKVVARGEVL
jgi:hypothetical protein